MIKLPFLAPVVPPHVFCLQPEGVTYARVRFDEPAGFEEARHFRYPGGPLAHGSGGAPLLSREAVAEAVKAARALSGGRLSRASVVYPDAWARILPVELRGRRYYTPTNHGQERDVQARLEKIRRILDGD